MRAGRFGIKRFVPLAALLLAGIAQAAGNSGDGSPCREGISRATAQRLFLALNHPAAEPACKFEGVSTDLGRLEARWSASGKPLPPLLVVPRNCGSAGSQAVGGFAVTVPPDVCSCPSVAPLIENVLSLLVTENPAGETGSDREPLFRLSRLLFVLILLLSAATAARAIRTVGVADRRWLMLGIGGFAVGLAVRAVLPFSMGNWYSEVLPASGPPPWPRFGPGFYAFQSLLRSAGVWGPNALVLSQLTVGALALPLLLGVLWELRVGIEASAATLVLLVFAPFHARLSATSSEHVLASTLCLGLLFAWLRALRGGRWSWLALTLLLFPSVCLTRVDMTVQALLVLPWPFLIDRIERAERCSRAEIGRRTLIACAVILPTLWVVYDFVVLPSHHPLPEAGARLFVLRQILPQYWYLATHPPGWISLPAVLLAGLGIGAMALRRRRLLWRVAGTVVIAFVALARGFRPDDLVGARYFLFTIPIFLIAAGQGFALLIDLVPARHRTLATAVGLTFLGGWCAIAAPVAYATRYAFQDEYSFLRGALGQLADGCRVYEVPIRSEALAVDTDCCLDVHRSPLTLDFPNLSFAELPENVEAIFDETKCTAYYESIACSIADDPDDPAVHGRAEKAAAYFQERCGAARRGGRLELLGEAPTSPLATVDFFHGQAPYARLYRWTR